MARKIRTKYGIYMSLNDLAVCRLGEKVGIRKALTFPNALTTIYDLQERVVENVKAMDDAAKYHMIQNYSKRLTCCVYHIFWEGIGQIIHT